MEWTIEVKPNCIHAYRLGEDGYLQSRSFIGYSMEEVEEILSEKEDEE